MKDTILIYHLENENEQKIREIAKDLDIKVQIIHDTDIHQTMGYLLGMKDFPSRDSYPHAFVDMKQPFVFFGLSQDDRLDMLLQLFRLKGLPHIPFKAVLTKHNTSYSFIQLYQSVQKEYQQMTEMTQLSGK